MSTAAQTPEIPRKPLQGKYDGRGKYDRSHLKNRANSKPGPKPQFLKHLSRNSAAKVLEVFDVIATLADIYREAWTRKNLALCVQMRENAWDRLSGRPFVAVNPDEVKAPHTLINDNRLQVAVENLLPNQKDKVKKRSKTRSVEAKLVDTKELSGDVAAVDDHRSTQEGPHPV